MVSPFLYESAPVFLLKKGVVVSNPGIGEGQEDYERDDNSVSLAQHRGKAQV